MQVVGRTGRVASGSRVHPGQVLGKAQRVPINCLSSPREVRAGPSQVRSGPERVHLGLNQVPGVSWSSPGQVLGTSERVPLRSDWVPCRSRRGPEQVLSEFQSSPRQVPVNSQWVLGRFELVLFKFD
jgi:hypothetical protein